MAYMSDIYYSKQSLFGMIIIVLKIIIMDNKIMIILYLI